jgi:hypothetical protein
VKQLAQYDARNYFEVTGWHTGKRYRIRHGMGANVYELDDAGRLRGVVLRTQGLSRRGRRHAGQKITLETGERGTLAVANNFTPR